MAPDDQAPVIPIRNAYFLLSYAWEHFSPAGVAAVDAHPDWDVLEILAYVFTGQLRRLEKRGLDRAYRPLTEELPGIRGKILAGASVKRAAFEHGRAVCEFDELTVDVLQNQILLASAERILPVLRSSGLQSELRLLVRRLRGVSSIRLTRGQFRQIQLHQNNAAYRLLLSVCELLFESGLVDEQGTRHSFAEFLRNREAMQRVFESFVRNFYRIRAPHYRAEPEVLRWEVSDASPGSIELLPTMHTDVTLRSPTRTIVIDTKYYPEALERGRFDSWRFHSENIYQMNAYLQNTKAQSPEGILLYPAARHSLSEDMRLNGRRLRFQTIDLSKDWWEIEQDLLSLVN